MAGRWSKVISEDDLDDNTPQTKGMKRYASSGKKCWCRKIWAGKVDIEPDAKTGASSWRAWKCYYVLSGKAKMRWGEKLEFEKYAYPEILSLFLLFTSSRN